MEYDVVIFLATIAMVVAVIVGLWVFACRLVWRDTHPSVPRQLHDHVSLWTRLNAFRR